MTLEITTNSVREGNVFSDSTRGLRQEIHPGHPEHLWTSVFQAHLLPTHGRRWQSYSGVQAVRHSQKAADRPSIPHSYHAPWCFLFLPFLSPPWWDLLGRAASAPRTSWQRLMRRWVHLCAGVCGYSCVGTLFPLDDYYHFFFFFLSTDSTNTVREKRRRTKTH